MFFFFFLGGGGGCFGVFLYFVAGSKALGHMGPVKMYLLGHEGIYFNIFQIVERTVHVLH